MIKQKHPLLIIPFLLIWTGLFMLWLCISTVLYSIIVIVLRPFSYNAAYAVMKNWCRMLVLLSGIRLKVEGLEKLDMNDHYMFIINHTSVFDIPILVIGIPLYTNFIAKKELFRIPLFGQGLRAIGHIPINRSNARKARGSIKDAVKQLHEKHRSMILFPEGTRSMSGRVEPFKRASFALVKEAGINMVPVLIHGADKVAHKKSWYLTPGSVTITISDPVDTAVVNRAKKEELMEMAYERIAGMQEGQVLSQYS